MTLSIEQDPSQIVERVAGFSRVLRSRAVLATPAETTVLIRALELIDFADRTEVFLAFRAVLASRLADLAIFDQAFAEWWPTAEAGPLQLAPRRFADAISRRPGHEGPQRSGDQAHGGLVEQTTDDAGEPVNIAMPTSRDAAAAKDFARYATDDLAEVERAAARIARRLNARPGRRWRRARRGARIDLRSIVRLSFRTGGDPIALARRERRLRRTRLVVLCDVSGSMDVYSRFLLQVLYALQHAFARIETFAFSTRLTRISESLARDTYAEALNALARERRAGWSGGTKIGENIDAFISGWPWLVDRRTVVVVLSDGWDTGDPELLGRAMRKIRRRAGRVVWLNPLLARPNYKPLTRGMQAALPHIDVFAPAHNVASLEALKDHLRI